MGNYCVVKEGDNNSSDEWFNQILADFRRVPDQIFQNESKNNSEESH